MGVDGTFMRTDLLTLTFVTLALIGLTPIVQAQPGQKKTATQLVSVEIRADTRQITPGQEFHLAFVFDIEPQWHIYWINPGSSGIPTQIDIKVPEGFEVGQTLFPRPVPFGSSKSPEGLTYGYEERAVLFVPIKAPLRLPSEDLSFKADIAFLVCKGKCFMGNVKRSIIIRATEDPLGLSRGIDPILAAAKKRIPMPLETLEGASLQFRGSTLTVIVPADEATNAMLFPIEMPGVTYADPQFEHRDGLLIMSVSVEVKPQNAQGKPLMLAGVIGLGDDRSDPCYAFELPLSGF